MSTPQSDHWILNRSNSWLKNELEGPLYQHLGMTETLYEQWTNNKFTHIIGMDEVGLGSWAGPLTVAAVVAPICWTHKGLRDSKQVKPESKRAAVVGSMGGLRDVSFYIVRIQSVDLDYMGAASSLLSAYQALLTHARENYPYALPVLDGIARIPGFEHVALPKADSFVPQCMAASLVAKVDRDTEMINYAKTYPVYGFAGHKGYGTAEHQEALEKYGPCPLHRRSYRPIRHLIERST